MSSPSSSVQEAKRALGRRLREIRKDAGITARELAARAGWQGMERQQVLRSGRHRFAMLVEESVLRTVVGDDPEVLAGQLGHLIAVASLPAVSVGIVPMGVPRRLGWPVESFTIYDDEQVNVELVSAHLTVTQPHEIHEYAKAFHALHEIAVYGRQARALITAAIDALG
ncbi:Scr1 family TA system antitoxin-like transcriptional regulator [Streptomyces sp. NPDC008001]|uniref:Scr1 family TA system antitoxin-like transcriptional regulator n=1 Tax=Streptomyces sp. NPDC008001 TaxID=3364804 RepID=UPI0036E09C39